MHRHSGFCFGILVFAATSFLLVRQASAYIDPGTGSYTLQLLIAGAVATLFTARMFLRNVLAFLGRVLGSRGNGPPGS